MNQALKMGPLGTQAGINGGIAALRWALSLTLKIHSSVGTRKTAPEAPFLLGINL